MIGLSDARQEQLAAGDILPLLHMGVLARDMKVAQAALQRGSIVNRAAAG
jgi:hypothetical protein